MLFQVGGAGSQICMVVSGGERCGERMKSCGRGRGERGGTGFSWGRSGTRGHPTPVSPPTESQRGGEAAESDCVAPVVLALWPCLACSFCLRGRSAVLQLTKQACFASASHFQFASTR